MIPDEVLERVARDLVEGLRDLVDEIVRERIAAASQERQAQREVMRIEEAAAALRLTVPATRARIRRGRLDGRKDGSRWLVSVESVRRAGGAVP